MKSKFIRILDANFNRVAEGLRVLEDISRFILNNSTTGLLLKNLRHRIIGETSSLSKMLLNERNIVSDFGSRAAEPSDKENITSIIMANARRAQEGLRVLEELSKLRDLKKHLNSALFKKARFDVYSIERSLVSQVLRGNKAKRIDGLYAILDTKSIGEKDILKVGKEIIDGGAKIIQLRDKHSEKRDLLSMAICLSELCSKNDILFIINDHLDIALAANADGLHIGQMDLPLRAVRQEMPIDKIIGCSVETMGQAKLAQRNGADYIAIGSIFPTESKEDIKILGLDVLRRVKSAVSIPVVAIGGITKKNIRLVLSAGADSIAVIKAIIAYENIRETTAELISIIETSH